MATVGHQRPPPQQAAQPTTQLEFSQAMKDFKTMFPEMDEDVIEVVLRANQGAVDATIDQLLAMSTDNENERIRSEMDAAEAPPGYSPTTPPPTYQQAVPYSQQCSPGSAILNAPYSLGCRDTKAVRGSNSSVSDSAGSRESTPPPPPLPVKSVHHSRPMKDSYSSKPQSVLGASPDIPLRESRQWKPCLLGPLPPHFLRIVLPKNQMKKSPAMVTKQGSKMSTVLCSEVLQQKMEENEKQRRLSTTEDPELVQYLEDERIALFLQNEEFMRELRTNKDFLTTLEKDAKSKSEDDWVANLSDADDSDSDVEKPPELHMSAFPYTKPFPTEESDAAFREKLKNMGKLSRRKFAQLARLFSRQKRRSAKQMYPYARLSEGSTMSKDNLLLDESNCRSDSEDESGRPLNEYHPIKNSSFHHGGSGSPSKYE
ncbi:hypothetical protein CHUAL_004543 [Chamberlinius hualienensis]